MEVRVHGRGGSRRMGVGGLMVVRRERVLAGTAWGVRTIGASIHGAAVAF